MCVRLSCSMPFHIQNMLSTIRRSIFLCRSTAHCRILVTGELHRDADESSDQRNPWPTDRTHRLRDLMRTNGWENAGSDPDDFFFLVYYFLFSKLSTSFFRCVAVLVSDTNLMPSKEPNIRVRVHVGYRMCKRRCVTCVRPFASRRIHAFISGV